jgi:hypothetical protein
MKYATWIIKQPQGTTPEPTIRANGGTASGGAMIDSNTVLGYLSDDVDISMLGEWNVIEKTQEQALALAQGVNPECFLADNGTIQTSPAVKI